MDEEPINPDVEKVYPPEVVASGVDPREDPLARNWKIPQVYSVGTTGVVVKSPPVVDDTPPAVATTKFVSPSEQNGMAANDDEDDEEEVEDRKPAKRKPRAKGKAKAKAKANAKRKSSAGSVGKQKTKRSDEEPAPKKKAKKQNQEPASGSGESSKKGSVTKRNVGSRGDGADKLSDMEIKKKRLSACSSAYHVAKAKAIHAGLDETKAKEVGREVS